MDRLSQKLTNVLSPAKYYSKITCLHSSYSNMFKPLFFPHLDPHLFPLLFKLVLCCNSTYNDFLTATLITLSKRYSSSGRLRERCGSGSGGKQETRRQSSNFPEIGANTFRIVCLAVKMFDGGDSERSADSPRPPQPVCQVTHSCSKQTRRPRSQCVPPSDFMRGGTNNRRGHVDKGPQVDLLECFQPLSGRHHESRGGGKKPRNMTFFPYCTMRRRWQQEEKTHLWEAQGSS